MPLNFKNLPTDLPTEGNRTRVAIACQGGGSHTSFTAGVLQGLIANLPDDVDVVALTGTSGGAICATLAWEGFVRNDRHMAIDKLQRFWESMSARQPVDKLINQALVGIMGLSDLIAMPEVSPYNLPTWGEDYFRSILEEYFNFDELRQLAQSSNAPVLQIGAVEVLSGHFELFTGPELSVECLLASAAIPNLFRAVAVPGRGMYWDGLFSQNPPIQDLPQLLIDELWLIQINSSTCAHVPSNTHEILDRRNDLAGNLSMEQEIHFIERLNRAVRRGLFSDPNFHPIEIMRIPLDRELNYQSKMDRRPQLIEELREYGKTKCRWFLRERQAKRAM